MCVIFHHSCEPHSAELLNGFGDAKLVFMAVNEQHRRSSGFDAGRVVNSRSEAWLKYLWDQFGPDPFSRGDVRELMKANNSFLYHILDDYKQLPDQEWTTKCAVDRPEYGEDYGGVLNTQELLETEDLGDFEGLDQLRETDTRTIIVVCAKEDTKGKVWYAHMEGCVMTIYPIAFKQGTRLRDVRPGSHIDEYGRCLAAIIIHELFHYKFAHKAIDFKLHRQDFDGSRTRISADHLFPHGQGYIHCYGHNACVALALSRHSHRWSIMNADSAMYVTITIALSRGHPEICFVTETGSPAYRDVMDFDVKDLQGRWLCFRHERARPIEKYEGYKAEFDMPREEVPIHRLFSHGPYPKIGDTLDACLDTIWYGGDFCKPWGYSPGD